uniref:NADH-ubiquinone oxidoreductase chain 4 n=1 Tax=Erotylinae sp. 2 ACP-2013 TaxID=1434613 RepID=A0A3G5FP07_9CUCU|nr:NADH dehydrogenase subunit 4 [Erotylinae sp. 2 ACP-2013]
MMKFIFFLLFMIPLCFMNYYWLFQFFFILISFLFMFKCSFKYYYIMVSYMFGVDLLSYSLIILSFWICFLMILASKKLFEIKYYYKMFMFVMVILMMSLMITFISMNLFIFYLFFEVSLIPILILIIGWGYQPERIEAGMYLLFYTLLVSLPMMIYIFNLYMMNGSLDFGFLPKKVMSIYVYLCINMVFFVKMPMFGVHLWLPKAHVEAPVAGSMILAGIMLKLGGYGMMRMMIMFLKLGISINLIFINISLIGGVVISLICMRQSDMKSLIAYSSVAHMGLVMAGILTLTSWGMWGALVMMLAHGLCSSGLFCLANISYERSHSRSFYLNKGMMNIMPNLSFWWFMFCASNMAAPPSLNLMGEIFLINSIVSYSKFLMILLMILSFFSAVYSLFMFAYTQHGVFYSGIYSNYSGTIREYLLLFLHWFPLNFLVLKSELVMIWI